MKTPIRIRYILLILLIMGGLSFWSLAPYQQRLAMLQQASAEGNFANTFTGSYLSGYIASKNGNWKKAAELFEESSKLAPENTALLENTYTFKLLYGEVKQAMALARQHPDNRNDSSVSVVLRATDAIQSGKYDQAARLIEEILPKGGIEVSVGTVISPFLHAWAKAGAGKEQEALAILQDMMKRDVASAVTSYHLALMYEYLGKPKEADAAYKQALSNEIKPYHFISATGNFYLRQGQAGKAKALFEAYVQDNPYSELFNAELALLRQGKTPVPSNKPDVIIGWRETLMEAVRVAYQSNLQDEGTAYLQLVGYLDPDFPQSLMLLANHYEAAGNFEKANSFYHRIPASSSFHWESRVNAARNQYKAGEKTQAEKALRNLAEERPENYAASLELAELLREDERFAVAADAYAQAVSRIQQPRKQHWYIFFAQGVSYEQSDQWDKAEVAFLKALELKPNQPDVLNYLGYSWLMQGKNTAKAQAMIETAIAERPDDAHIMDSMGWALFNNGKYEKAAYYLEQAIENMPYDPTVNDHLGDLYWKLGRFREAQYQWQRVLKDASPAPDEKLVKEVNEKLLNGLSSGESSATPRANAHADKEKQLSTNEHPQ